MTAPLWGAEPEAEGYRFRLWAPSQRALTLRLGGRDLPMRPEADGWYVLAAEARPGDAYGFVLENGLMVPDPAARAQRGDVHGPSLLVDPGAYAWATEDWAGRPWHEAVICELHVGTFTPEGTYRAAIERLDHLAETGFTAIELMPLSQFDGARGWGYDGVLLRAPHNAYGTPDDLRALIDAAHARGLMVFLDIVFNHFGASGNYLPAYAPDFFRKGGETPWGAAIAYHLPPVRAFFVEAALGWLAEYRFDGLRLDAIDYVRDPESDPEILIDIARQIRAAFPDRAIHLATEDNRNVTHLHERGEDGGVPLYTAEWNDDFHNAAHVIATGETEGYYIDFAEGHWEVFGRILAEGFGFQGEHSAFQDQRRGQPSAHLPPVAFVDFLQNHDQIGNRAYGERLSVIAKPERLRALTAILLLSPHIPLMFMGEEWGETTPFVFFTDFHGELAELVRQGRRREFAHFAAFRDEAARATIPDPNEPGSLAASRIDWGHRETEAGAAALGRTRDLLATRAREIVPRLARAPGGGGRLVAAEEGVLAVDWRLDGATLRLRANLDDRPRAVPPGAGRAILGGPGAELPAGEVVFLIEEDAP
ncbi:malto-oligosyltrehalose trehalohydrolase [Amaricoccus solimangrovi]|uniref:malto-oligosyltrehalose trehalohydrolase n=1 Tax=Amaricoccus solimangrovi TaxID=2589815 RepID=UPI001F37A834|nr:malto-oligosyltrehalose trehalohydrolase [Amaricoccus solimangrovi]